MQIIAGKEFSRSVSDRKNISIIDAIAIVAGMVIGPGIFKTPSIVAAHAGNEIFTLGLWLLGGLISLIGAFCYAELASTYPNTGGEYHFIVKSYGKKTAFLFAWARMTVIQTGSIAMLSFVIGDYASEAFRLGDYSPSLYAAITVLILTAVNLNGLKPSSKLQKVLMGGIMFGIMFIVAAGLFSGASGSSLPDYLPLTEFALGQAMIFVLLTYGGWNEAAYLSAEIRSTRSGIVKVLFFSIALITGTYLLTNFALIEGLGFLNVTSSDAVAADLVEAALGSGWVKTISIIIAVAAFSTVNAVMITGARSNYALGNDFKTFKFLSRWKEHEPAPVYSFVFQSFIALLLIILGTVTRNGFITMVEYTAPVFWFFLLLIGISLIILRIKEPEIDRPFRVPLYPFIPILFCIAAAYMLYSSLVYTGIGAVIGVMVLLAGLPFLLLKNN